MNTCIKKIKLKNNIICITNKWLNDIKNYNYYNYKCEIIKKEEIESVVNFINKNDNRFKINDISFFNYIYLKITKCNKNNIYAVVVLKKQNLFLKDENDFKLYDSVCIDYICKEKSIVINNDNVIYEEDEIPLKTVFSNNLEIKDIINISISTFLKMYNTNTLLCFMYSLNMKKVSYNDDITSLFCKKYFYYRPISIDKLTKSQILNSVNNNNRNIFLKIYNTFSYHVSFLKNVKIEFIVDAGKYDEFNLHDLSEELSNKLLEYNRKNKDVFDYIDKDEMYNILKSSLFYKFIIRNNDDEIINFVCIKWSYITNNIGEKKVYSKNGKYYCSFYSNSSSIYISYILEAISEYCYRNDILDIITLEDFFTGDDTNYFKLIKKCSSYYYIKNIKTSFVINSRKNGLIGMFN